MLLSVQLGVCCHGGLEWSGFYGAERRGLDGQVRGIQKERGVKRRARKDSSTGHQFIVLAANRNLFVAVSFVCQSGKAQTNKNVFEEWVGRLFQCSNRIASNQLNWLVGGSKLGRFTSQLSCVVLCLLMHVYLRSLKNVYFE